MSDRFCPQCGSEVEDTGGFCLLGHSLRETAPTDSLAALRAEVDKAFEEARVLIAHTQPLQAPQVAQGASAGAQHAAPAPPPSLPVTTVYPRIEEPPTQGPDPITEFAPAPRMDWGPERRQGLLKRLG